MFFNFTVTGFGHFPLDMLANARCHPLTVHDARKLLENDSRDVRLASAQTPDHLSWNIYGWRVNDVQEAQA